MPWESNGDACWYMTGTSVVCKHFVNIQIRRLAFLPLSEEKDGGSFSLRPSVVLAKELYLRYAGAGDAE